MEPGPTAPVRPETRDVLSGALFAAIFGLLFLLEKIPVIGVAAGIAAPFPVAVMYLRAERIRPTFVMALAGTLVVLLLAGPISSLLAVQAGIVGLTLGYGISKRFAATTTVLWTGIAYLVSFLAVIALLSDLSGADLGSTVVPDQVLDEFRADRDRQIGELRAARPKELAGLPDALLDEQVRAVSDRYAMLETMVRMSRKLFPAVLVGWSLVLAAIYYAAFELLLLRIGTPAEPLPPFARFRVPWPFAWLLLLSWAGQGVSSAAFLLVNLGTFVLLLVFVEGLAVLWEVLNRLRAGPFARFLTLGAALVLPPFPVVIGLVGLFDMFVDFRRLDAVPLDGPRVDAARPDPPDQKG